MFLTLQSTVQTLPGCITEFHYHAFLRTVILLEALKILCERTLGKKSLLKSISFHNTDDSNIYLHVLRVCFKFQYLQLGNALPVPGSTYK